MLECDYEKGDIVRKGKKYFLTTVITVLPRKSEGEKRERERERERPVNLVKYTCVIDYPRVSETIPWEIVCRKDP